MENQDLNVRLAALSPAKRALLEQKLKQAALDKPFEAVPIPRRTERVSAPLSFAQQRLWFLSQLEAASSSYNESSAIRLRGPLSRAALQAAIDQLMERHEVLRTYLVTVEGEPRQVVNEAVKIDLPVIDLRGVPIDRREQELQQTLWSDMRRPFDLSRELPLRLTIVQTGDQEHVLLKVMHHIASDGWSTAIFWRELGLYYRDFLAGNLTNLPALPIQYQDYAVWQRAWLQGEILQEQLNYWKKTLAGLEPLNLPTDRQRIAGKKSPAARAALDLEDDLTASLKALSRQHGVTLFMTLLAAFQTLLQRYCGQSDIVVGSPIAGRTKPELESLIGFFVNTLVLRLDLANDPTFVQLLLQARDVALGAYAHQELPFEKIVEELNPVRDLDTLPLFNVMFAHQTFSQVAVEFAGLEVSAIDVPSLDAKFDLFLAVIEREGHLRLRVDYAADLFDAATMERVLVNFQMLLQSIVAHPERRISELDLIAPVEKQKLLLEWNDTKKEYLRDKCVHELFDAQAQKTPDAVALICQDQQLTYGALNTRVNQLAHYLQQLGVGPGDAVALCMERSIEVVLGLLAVLKAGAVYVPLEPQYPEERLRFMLEDTRATVMLTQQAIVEDRKWRMEDGSSPSSMIKSQSAIVCLDRDWPEIGRQSEAAPENYSTPDDLAYIVYTSGSTGVPKGVLGHHRGLVNRFAWMWNVYPFEPGAVCCQKTSLCFVDSLWELLGPLLRGVPTIIVPEAEAKDPAALITTLADHQVSRIVLVPSLLRAMLEVHRNLQARLPKLKFWVSSGEALSGELIQAFRRGLPDSRLINLYGSSEVAADATCWEVDGDSPLIGRPIDNTQVYILDEHRSLVPVGVSGELFIGGDGVVHGYLNQTELTAERFIKHSFDGVSQQRLYKTGDRARYRADGNIEFLGRRDHQVKVRGHRIELGEIEATLTQHPKVRQCAVVLNESREPPSDSWLVAYFTSTAVIAPDELRKFLRQKLPEPMIPAVFVTLETLPLTPSGKPDRQALAKLAGAASLDHATFVKPRTPNEQMLAEVWAEVLKVERVGVDDNFFDLGGHSLLLVRLSARIKKVTGQDIPLATLFRAPTIAQLAACFERESHSETSSTLIPIQPGGSQPPFFCAHGAWGSVVFCAELSRRFGQDQPFYGLQAPGMEGEQEPLTKIEDMAAHHVREIRRVQPDGPYFLAGLSLGGLIAFEMAQQLVAHGQRVALLALIDTHRPAPRSWARVWGARARRLLTDDVFGRVVFHGRNLVLSSAGMGSTYTREKTRFLAKKVAAKLQFDHQGSQAHLSDVYAVKVRKANFTAMRRYQPRPYPGRVCLLTTPDSPFAKQGERGGWQELALGGLDTQVVPGNHSTMLSESHVGVLAETLRRCLQDAQASQR